MIDRHTESLEAMLRDKRDYVNVQSGTNRGMVSGAERDVYVDRLLRFGNFLGMDSKSLLIACYMFDRFQCAHCIQLPRHFCPAQCFGHLIGRKRKTGPCKMCSLYKTLMTYNV